MWKHVAFYLLIFNAIIMRSNEKHLGRNLNISQNQRTLRDRKPSQQELMFILGICEKKRVTDK